MTKFRAKNKLKTKKSKIQNKFNRIFCIQHKLTYKKMIEFILITLSVKIISLLFQVPIHR
jgi:hypothetical protein